MKKKIDDFESKLNSFLWKGSLNDFKNLRKKIIDQDIYNNIYNVSEIGLNENPWKKLYLPAGNFSQEDNKYQLLRSVFANNENNDIIATPEIVVHYINKKCKRDKDDLRYWFLHWPLIPVDIKNIITD